MLKKEFTEDYSRLETEVEDRSDWREQVFVSKTLKEEECTSTLLETIEGAAKLASLDFLFLQKPC